MGSLLAMTPDAFVDVQYSWLRLCCKLLICSIMLTKCQQYNVCLQDSCATLNLNRPWGPLPVRSTVNPAVGIAAAV